MPRPLHLTEAHVARATRPVPEVWATTALTRADDAVHAARVARLMRERPEGRLTVFAYGSLIWNPTFQPAARLRAVAHGWHRQFCMEIRGFRGTPEAPGLMMALMSGGRCAGIGMEIAEDAAEATLDGLVRRELPFVENEPDVRWITLSTEAGPRRALVFWAGPTGPSIRRGLPLDAAARQIARACGWRGSSAEYVRNTVLSLQEHGITDRNLWKLQRLVAEEIERAFPLAGAAADAAPA